MDLEELLQYWEEGQVHAILCRLMIPNLFLQRGFHCELVDIQQLVGLNRAKALLAQITAAQAATDLIAIEIDMKVFGRKTPTQNKQEIGR